MRSSMLDPFYSSCYLISGISALLFSGIPSTRVCAAEHMTMMTKYNLQLLDFDIQFSLWQVKMQVVLVHQDLDETLEGFGNMDLKTWMADELRKDQKMLSMIHLQLSNNVLWECLDQKFVAAL
jgi:hypothetical protein